MSYAKITICGLNLPKLLRYLCCQGVTIYQTQRSGKFCQIVVAKTDYSRTVALVEQKCYNIQKVEFFGAVCTKSYLQKHWLLFCFLALFILATAVCCNFCLRIVISGDFEENIVAQGLAELGVTKWTNLSRLDVDATENALANKLDATYAVITRKASVLYVNVIDKKRIETPIDMATRRDIVATRDGVVTYLLCEQGTPCVAVGDVVKKGDLLISGVRTFNDGTTCDVYAIGNVTLEFSVEAFAPYTGVVQQLQSTGNSCKVTQVVLFGKTYGKGCDYEKFTQSYSSVFLYPINLEIRIVTYEQTHFVTTSVTLQESLPYLQQQALQEAQKKCDFDIKNSQFVTTYKGVTAILFGEVTIT